MCSRFDRPAGTGDAKLFSFFGHSFSLSSCGRGNAVKGKAEGI